MLSLPNRRYERVVPPLLLIPQVANQSALTSNAVGAIPFRSRVSADSTGKRLVSHNLCLKDSRRTPPSDGITSTVEARIDSRQDGDLLLLVETPNSS